MRRAPVDPGRKLRKAIECLASYKMVPAVYGLPNTTSSLPIGHSNVDDVFAAQGLAQHSASGGNYQPCKAAAFCIAADTPGLIQTPIAVDPGIFGMQEQPDLACAGSLFNPV